MGGEDIGKNQITAVGNRVYTNDVRSPPFLQPAEAGFVCVDAVSNRRVSNRRVSNRRVSNRRVFNLDCRWVARNRVFARIFDGRRRYR
ncbi:MAG: hypothetical protein EAZ33_20845 [Oscillatoriales cyanobacterium]|nr:MAG: hypothetical protein EAZ33_20845 [Oscillatoriales cyanobacterium]